MEEDVISQVDICIVMDTTGSMRAFIEAAKEEARKQAEKIAENADLDIRYAVVEYRDHPPEDLSFVTRVYPFGGAEQFQTALNGLSANGGGDEPEAVLDGLVEAANLQWRTYADKLCFLIGDSPPHGVGEVSRWPEGCPCKATPNGVVELFASKGIKLHALSIAGNPLTLKSFTEMAEAIPGGTVRGEESPVGVTAAFVGLVSRSGEMVGASRSFMASADSLMARGIRASVDNIAEDLGWTEDMVAGTAKYLASRGIPTDGDAWLEGEEDSDSSKS